MPLVVKLITRFHYKMLTMVVARDLCSGGKCNHFTVTVLVDFNRKKYEIKEGLLPLLVQATASLMKCINLWDAMMKPLAVHVRVLCSDDLSLQM